MNVVPPFYQLAEVHTVTKKWVEERTEVNDWSPMETKKLVNVRLNARIRS